MVQLSQPKVTTGDTIALAIYIFVSRVMSLLFRTQSRFVIGFLPRNNGLTSWLQFGECKLYFDIALKIGSKWKKTCMSYTFWKIGSATVC